MRKHNSLFFLAVWFWAIGTLVGFISGPSIADIGLVPDFGFGAELLGVDAFIKTVFLSIASFVLSALFFGYGSLIGFLVTGFWIGKNLYGDLSVLNIVANVLLVLPIWFSGYAGILFGRSAFDDMVGSSNLRKAFKQIAILAGLSIGMSVVVGIALSSKIFIYA
ncbi:MAG: hypothetical protein GOV15_02400 [Candidatus Diapherotrites archaeon]|nr:hypothetical protein [Candidatus Diapherotrites archaeon]